MRRRLTLVALLMALAMVAAPASAEEGKVQAVLFFSPSCGHCEYVINDLLLPIWFPQYGGEPEWTSAGTEDGEAAFFLATNGTLEIVLVDVAVEAGAQFYYSSAQELNIPQNRMGVPRLVVGDDYYVGSGEIPDEFPGIIEAGLASGGIEWPDLISMEEIVAGLTGDPSTTTVPDTTTTTIPSGSTTTNPSGSTTTTQGTLPIGGDSPWERFERDKVANSLALAVLALMVLSLIGVFAFARRGDEAGGPGVAVPLLAVAGLAVAAYLAFVETSGSEAVCGPVGDCNTVQQSEWAQILGIHIGVIGVAGYAVALAAWAVARWAGRPLADWARLALFAGALAGTAFSVYLTFLEPFVIGATCLWCLTSAVIVTALMWLTARPAAAAWARLRAGD